MHIITPPMRISYPALFTAKMPNPKFAKPGQQARFKCDLLKEKDLTGPAYEGQAEQWEKEFDELQEAVMNILLENHTMEELEVAIKMKAINNPFKTHAAQSGEPLIDLDIYDYVLQPWANADSRPLVVDRWVDPKDPEGRPVVINDPAKIYPGCYVRAMLNPYYYKSGTKGVNFGLIGVQFWADGDRLDTRAGEKEVLNAFKATAKARPTASLAGAAGSPSGPGAKAHALKGLLG